MQKLKVGVIIPDRNDRPRFLKNCLRLLENQTLKPEIIELVNYAPLSENVDITQRYKYGYEKLRNKGLDVIAFIENDEWYSNDYLETMVNAWENAKRPDIFGTDYTIYYHIKLLSYYTMYHDLRSSAMSTLIKPDLNFEWCRDSEPYTDMHLWTNLKGVTFRPEKHICLGIKHGVGMCGGHAHTTRLQRYKSDLATNDSNTTFLKSLVDIESYKFYCEFFINN